MTAGATEFTGKPATTTVDAVQTVLDPSRLEAETAATTNLPAWAAVGVNAEPVAPVMTEHVDGKVWDAADVAVQASHEFLMLVGLLAQVPFDTFKVDPTRAVPVNAGETVDAGTAASAESALMTANSGADRATAATIATMRFNFVKRFMDFHLSTIKVHISQNLTINRINCLSIQ